MRGRKRRGEGGGVDKEGEEEEEKEREGRGEEKRLIRKERNWIRRKKDEDERRVGKREKG